MNKSSHLSWFKRPAGLPRSRSTSSWALPTLGCLFAAQMAFGFRVYPTVWQIDEMYDKANFPFISQNADGIKYAPPGVLDNPTLFLSQFTNKNVMDEGTWKPGQDVMASNFVKSLPAGASITAHMSYSESLILNLAEINSHNYPFPIVNDFRAYTRSASQKAIIDSSGGIMFEMKVDDPGKYPQAVDLIIDCIDKNKLVIFLNATQGSLVNNLSCYKTFFYYLKKNLPAKYLASPKLIFCPSTYDPNNVLPDNPAVGSTFGIAHWLIDQKNQISDGYLQPTVTWNSPSASSYSNGSNLTASLSVAHSTIIKSVKLYVDGVLVSEKLAAPYSWSGGPLNNVQAGVKQLQAVVVDINDVVSTHVNEFLVLAAAPTVPGYFTADNVSSYSAKGGLVPGVAVKFVYTNDWLNYKLNVQKTGLYDVRVNIYIQRPKYHGGTVVLNKNGVEISRFDPIMNKPALPALPGFSQYQTAIFHNVPLTAGMDSIRLTFDRPDGENTVCQRINTLDIRMASAPIVELLKPNKDGDEYLNLLAPADLPVNATVTSPTGTAISKADLFINDVLVRSITKAPFSWITDSKINNLPNGSYKLEVRATDANGFIGYAIANVRVITRTPFAADMVIPGTIQAWKYDLGGEGIAYHDWRVGADRGLTGVTTPKNPRFDIAGSEDVEIEGTSPNYCISYVSDGEWSTYTIQSVQAGIYDVSMVAATTAGRGVTTASLWLNANYLGQIKVDDVGANSFTNFKTFSATGIVIPMGLALADLRVKFENPSISETLILLFWRTLKFVRTGTTIAADKLVKNPISIHQNTQSNRIIINALGNSSMKLIGMDGKVHISGNNMPFLNTKELESGLYFLQIQTANQLHTFKVLHQSH
jgi:hypothetical protein